MQVLTTPLKTDSFTVDSVDTFGLHALFSEDTLEALFHHVRSLAEQRQYDVLSETFRTLYVLLKCDHAMGWAHDVKENLVLELDGFHEVLEVCA